MKNDLLETNGSSDIQLSRHFRLSEFTRSATAIRYGIDNQPDVESIEALQSLCINVLEPLRMRFGVIRITSGYRCLQLNERVGGSRTSQHLLGEAADIHVGSLEVARKYLDFIRENLDFDQMLLEMKAGRVHCLHVSYTAERVNRRMVRTEYGIS